MTKNIYDEIGYPSVKNYNEIGKLTDPLKQFFGIDRFWRNTLSRDGLYSVVGNNPATAEIFFGERYYQGHPFFRDPAYFCSGYSLPELLNHEEYEATQGRLKKDGDCFHILTIIQKHAHSFVEYGFASSIYQPGFETIYLNHLHAIYTFIDYFEEHASHVLSEAEERNINIAEIIGDTFYKNPHISLRTFLPDQELKFFATLEKDQEFAQAILSLTDAEKRCLKHYLSGITIKETAKTLFLSPRTVESHISNSKSKLNVQTRSELFRTLLPYRDFL